MTDLVFDGHNDALSRLWCAQIDPIPEFDTGGLHITRKAAKAGGLAGGFFALFATSARQPFDFARFIQGGAPIPVAPPLAQEKALATIMAQIGLARQLEAAGHLRFCTTGSALAADLERPGLSALLHLEGADPIDPDLYVLDALYAQGLRSLGPVWSRQTPFGDGVPFAFGQDGDTGPGLTPLGHRLVARCKALGVIVDTSHLTLKGFWDVAEAGLPLVATHSNAFAQCPVTRNLTDDQLRAIGQTKGMVGLNFGTLFLSESGWSKGQADTSDMIRHLEHMVTVAGEDHVGLGSDFDGAPLPRGIDSAADLPRLVEAMRTAQFGETLIAKLLRGNWMAFLTRNLG